MRWTLERLIEPLIEPISRAELRVHLRAYDTSDEDDWLDDLIQAGREWVENYTGRALVDQTWRQTMFGNGINWDDLNTVTPVRPGYSCGEFSWSSVQEIQLRRSPVIALTSFKSVDSAGTETAVDATSYALREGESKWPRIAALSGSTWNEWMQYDLRVLFRAGYADRTGSPTEDASVIPARYKSAIKLHCEAHYNRDPETMKALLDAAKGLLRSDRVELSLA